MKKTIIRIVIALALVVGGLFTYNLLTSKKADTSSKQISIEVVDRTVQPEAVMIKSFKVSTDAATLGDALEDVNKEGSHKFTLSGSKSDQFGRALTKIDGVEGDFTKPPFWLYESTNNKECVASGFCSGVDQLPIESGDHFIFILSNGQ